MALKMRTELAYPFGGGFVGFILVTLLRRIFPEMSKDSLEAVGLGIPFALLLAWTLIDPRGRNFWVALLKKLRSRQN